MALEKTVQDKNVEIRQLQKHSVELERAKHTEVVKLRLEVGTVHYFNFYVYIYSYS